MNTALEIYRKNVFKKICFIILLISAILFLSLAGLGSGPMKLTTGEIVGAMLRLVSVNQSGLPFELDNIITRIRLPRVILALLSGFGLGIVGMQMQVVLRNPLASPLTLGVSAGAALGAGLAIIAGFTIVGGRYMLIANAFVFSLIPCATVYALSRMGANGHGMLILAGVAMNFIFSSVSTLLSYFSNSEELKSLSLWMMGNLGRATWNDILPLAVVMVFIVPLLFLQNQKLNILNAGDESAQGLGVNVERTRITVLVLTALISATIICFTGIIGFVGLVAPHIVRLCIGNDARFLMPASGLFGSVFLLGSDIISLKIIEPAVIPVGIITSFIGGPVLLFLIIRQRGSKGW